MNYQQHTKCRICGSQNLIGYLNLGNLPLTNNLCSTAEENPDKYPLQVMVCTDCWLSQLSIVVNPSIMFSDYVYRSSISKTFIEHCKKMAIDLRQQYGLNENSFHIDIAGNDGCLLLEFKKILGHKVLNVDPAKNLYEINENLGIRMFCSFWGVNAANHLNNTQWGKADLITATNVIAHLDNLYDFFEGIKMALKPTGVFIIECPYLIDFIENKEFPTLYQEHVSVMSISPINRLCKEMGLTVMKVEKQDIHCGSVRIHIGYGEQQQSVLDFMKREEQYQSLMPYLEFAKNSFDVMDEFKSQLRDLKSQGYKIAGFACSAKGNTLLNCTGVKSNIIDYIVDDTPEKQNMFSPGTQIPVKPISILKENAPDYIIILSWNFDKEIIDRCRSFGYTGRFIIPIPNFKLIF